MILQALVRHYEDLLEKGEIPKPGWGNARVSFLLNLDRKGRIIDLLPLRVAVPKGTKTVYEPQSMEVPQPVKRSVDINPNFLCDNSSYVLGIDEKGKPERTAQCFMAFSELHRTLLQGVKSDAANAILLFLDRWKPEDALKHQCMVDNWREIMSGANMLFCYEDSLVTEDEEIRDCWQQHYNSIGAVENGICMVTGRKVHIATLHPVIKGVYGAQAMGTSLVSFNAPAFCSYGKEQGTNASVGEYAAAAYGAALNSLLGDRDHVKWIGDTTIVCWVEGGEKIYQDVGIAALFGDEDKITHENLSAILKAVVAGQPIEMGEWELEPNKHFYILGVAPNTARLTVRFFLQDSFGNMLRNIGRHYDRLEIVKPLSDKYEYLPCWKLLQETVRGNQNSKAEGSSPQMAADTMKAILTGGTYPASLLNGVMLRIRAEHKVTRGRAAIIKAYYLRNKNTQCPEEVLQMALNEESTNIPYNLGRLFAVLEQIQHKANPSINTTIKDKYFNAAAAAPANIFPLLIDLAQKHMRKLENKGTRIKFQTEIQSIADKFGEKFPSHLSIPQQGSFYLGYYHQMQKGN